MVRKTRHHDIEKLKDVIDGLDTAMLTTVNAQGRLVSRPLRMQEMDEAGAMWFVTDRDSHKTEEIAAHPQVNLSFASPRDNTYVSISGKATVLFDKARLRTGRVREHHVGLAVDGLEVRRAGRGLRHCLGEFQNILRRIGRDLVARHHRIDFRLAHRSRRRRRGR